MELLLCVLIPFAVGMLIRVSYTRLPGMSGKNHQRWEKRLELMSKIYFALGGIGFSLGAAHMLHSNVKPEEGFSLQYYSLMIGWLLGFAAIQFMRRHYHSGELAAELNKSKLPPMVRATAEKAKQSKKRKNSK